MTGLESAVGVSVPGSTADTAAAVRVRTSWAWTGWASWPLSGPVLAAAAAALALDVVSAWSGVPAWRLGRIVVSPALPPAALLVVLMARARRARTPRRGGRVAQAWSAWREFLVVGVAACGAVAVLLGPAIGTGADLGGVLLAVTGEEVVFRLAAVVLVGAACARICGRDWRDTARWGAGPAVAGLAAAALSFTLLPGHVVQITGWVTAVPFGSLSVLLGYSVLRTGTVVPAVVAHVWLDLMGLAHRGGAVPAEARAALAATGLVALVWALMRAGARLGLRRRVPVEIDLRDGVARSGPGRRRLSGDRAVGVLGALPVPGTVGRDLLDVGPEL